MTTFIQGLQHTTQEFIATFGELYLHQFSSKINNIDGIGNFKQFTFRLSPQYIKFDATRYVLESVFKSQRNKLNQNNLPLRVITCWTLPLPFTPSPHQTTTAWIYTLHTHIQQLIICGGNLFGDNKSFLSAQLLHWNLVSDNSVCCI